MSLLAPESFTEINKAFTQFATELRLREAKFGVISRENAMLKLRNRQLAGECESLKAKVQLSNKKLVAEREDSGNESNVQIESLRKELQNVQSQLKGLQEVHELVLAERTGLQVSNVWLRKRNKELNTKINLLVEKGKQNMDKPTSAPTTRKKRATPGTKVKKSPPDRSKNTGKSRKRKDTESISEVRDGENTTSKVNKFTEVAPVLSSKDLAMPLDSTTDCFSTAAADSDNRSELLTA